MKLTLRLCSVLAFAGCAPTLAGQLRTPDGMGVASAEGRVNITSLSDASAAEPRVVVAGVDADGHFATSEELPPGEYLVEALVPGYALTSQRMHLGDGASVAMTLKPLATAKAEVTHINANLNEGRGEGGATLTPPSL